MNSLKLNYLKQTELFSNNLLNWYENNARILPWRKNTDPYTVWVSEIMLQQTQVKTVNFYFIRFMQAFPKIEDFANSSEDNYLKLWEGLGYYSRVRNMHKTAKIIVDQFAGKFPNNYDDLLKLPGIGPYTAAAIASICFNQALPAIDGNLMRIFSRLNCYPQDIKLNKTKQEAFQFFEKLIDVNKPGEFNQALMDLGSSICLAKTEPLCKTCPIQNFCLAYQDDVINLFPKRSSIKKRKIEKRTIFLIHHDHKILLGKRPHYGLLANLYEFPNIKGHLSQGQTIKIITKTGFNPIRIKELEPSKHIFSHLEWQMIAYEIWTDEFSNSNVKNILEDNSRDFSGQDKKTKKASSFNLNERDDAYLTLNQDCFLSCLEDIKNKWSIPSAFNFYKEYLL